MINLINNLDLKLVNSINWGLNFPTIIIIELRFKGLGKVPGDPRLCLPLGGDENLFYDYFRVTNSVWVLGARHMCN